MSILYDFCKKARYVAEKAAEKTGEAIETAAFALKKKALEMRLDEQYEKLGELLYRRFKSGEDAGEEEAAVMAVIEELLAKIEALKKDAENEGEQETEEAGEQEPEQTDDPA